MPNLIGASTNGVSGIAVGDQILLLGLADRTGLRAVPAEHRRDLRGLFDRLALYPAAVEALRQFWPTLERYPPAARPSDRDLISSLGRAIGRGEIDARVVIAARTHQSLRDLTSMRSVQIAMSADGATPGRAPAYSASPSPRPTAPPNARALGPGTLGARSIADWRLYERIEEILRRAAGRAPGQLGARLKTLATPENLSLLAAGVVASGAGDTEGASWMAEPLVAAIGYAYAGLGAFPGLADVHGFAARAGRARSEADLEVAADALGRAMAIFGLLGLASILHRSAGENSGRGPGSEGDESPNRSSRPQAATGARPVPTSTPTPAGELATARTAIAKGKAEEEGLLAKARQELALLRKQYADAVARLRARADALLARARAEKAALEKRVAELEAEAKDEEAALGKKLAEARAALKKEEAELEKIAREAQAERKAIGERLKALQDQEKRAEAEARNLAKYGDKLGPTIDALTKSGKSAERIIESAGRSGGKPLGL